MGFFSGLNAEQYDRQYPDRVLARRMAGYFIPHWRRLAVVVTLSLSLALLSAFFRWITARGLDWLKWHSWIGIVIGVSMAVLIGGVYSWNAQRINRRIMIRTITSVILKLRTDAFRSAARHDLSFYDQFSSGKIVSRITSDTQDFGQLVSIITDVMSQFIESAVVAIMLFNIDWRLSLYVMALIPIAFILTISYRSLARRATRQGMRAMANVNSTIKETVSGIAIAKNFRQEASVYKDFDEANRTSYRVNVWRGLTLALVFPSLNAISGIATAVLVYTGGLSVKAGLVSAGSWYLFILSLDRFLFPVMNLSSFWTSIQNGLSAAERIFALIDAEPAVVQTNNQTVPPIKGEVVFDHVQFCYQGNEQESCVLEDFNLHIQPGETIALVGHTGAGKTSVARLIARFYEFQKGKILIDGADIRSFDLTSYRRQLGIVSQVPFLFSGTVAENIRYAHQEITDSDIQSLARQIGDGEWLDAMPDGLQTKVGERGALLSMGQRQLVALMRVLAQHPAIFILDEATASIDPFTEWQIQQALNLILAQSTSILVAHRLSTVKSAHRIIVMENGQIIEEGNHVGLLQRGGHYATLYNTYFRHQSIDYRPEGLDEWVRVHPPIPAK
jgi:ATP-binding cassette, subfamily B, bacterial